MTHRALGVLLLLGVLAVLVAAPAGIATATSTPTPVTASRAAAVPNPPDTSVTAVTDNDFIPADRDLSDCVSALPQPDCGSEARSGWRQWAIFGLLAVALSFIAWRIVRSSRRARTAGDGAPDDA